jgi:hypothetical protein
MVPAAQTKARSICSPHAPPGPARCATPEEHTSRRWSGSALPLADGPGGMARCRSPTDPPPADNVPPPAQDEMERMAFEVSMVLRAPIKDAAGLEHAQNETLGLLHVIPALQASTASGRCNFAAILQSACSDHATEQENAVFGLGLARLRQHVRIKIGDVEDLKCAHKALQEAAAFFDTLGAAAELDGTCRYALFLRLTA